MSYRDLGYNGFLTKTIISSTRQSPIQARNTIGMSSLSALSISSPLNATTGITFSSTDNDTAAWTTGVIYFSDGSNSGQVAAGNTGNITATTYVYFDKEKAGELKTTTDPAEATGPLKFMVAIVEEGESGKKCKITPTIAAGLVVSDLTADQIKAGEITLSEVVTGDLDDIADGSTYVRITGTKESNYDNAYTLANSVQTASFTEISPGKVLISGSTHLDDWRNATDATKIDGGNIYTNTISAQALKASTISVGLNVGEDNIKIDGANKRIIVNDGTNNRIVIGNV
jgi:hypothetical protein